MKKHLLLIGISVMSFALFAKDIPAGQIPATVMKQFNKDFPKAKDVEWELKNNVYNVDFEQGWFTDFEAWYSADGTLLRLEEDICKRKLPKAIIVAIKSNYPSFKIDDVKKITENKRVTYKVEIEKRSYEHTLYFNEKGQIIK